MRHVGTAPGIWDDVRETSGSNANGWWRKRPDGIIEQGGTVALSNGTGTVTFPIPFPSACQKMDLTPLSVASGTNSSVDAWLSAVPTKTSATINGRNAGTVLGVLTISAGAFSVMWSASGA